MKPIKLILIRHGDRHSDGRPDPGLTDRGQEQAQAFLSAMTEEQEPSIQLFSSPKRRCQETLEPIASNRGLEVQVDPLLDEQLAHEDYSVFIDRISSFILYWKTDCEPGQTWIACSHADWVPAALEELTGKPVVPKKGQWLTVEIQKPE